MPEQAASFIAKSTIKAADREHRRKINFNIAKYNAVVPVGKQQFEDVDNDNHHQFVILLVLGQHHGFIIGSTHEAIGLAHRFSQILYRLPRHVQKKTG